MNKKLKLFWLKKLNKQLKFILMYRMFLNVDAAAVDDDVM